LYLFFVFSTLALWQQLEMMKTMIRSLDEENAKLKK